VRSQRFVNLMVHLITINLKMASSAKTRILTTCVVMLEIADATFVQPLFEYAELVGGGVDTYRCIYTLKTLMELLKLSHRFSFCSIFCVHSSKTDQRAR
jgi:hypothetical protein